MINRYNLKGLSENDVSKQKKLGLSNEIIDSYSPSTLTIIRRNYFNFINLILISVITALAIFSLWKEVLVFASFVIINSAFGVWDQIRVKKRLEELKKEFQRTAKVIRDGKIKEIPASEIVIDDLILAREGEGIIADGVVVYEKLLQIDESMLTGESDYIIKKVGDEVLSGSFVVTGEIIYQVQNVGKQNYLNRLGTEATSFKQTRSELEKIGNFIALLLALMGFVSAVTNFILSNSGDFSNQQKVLAVTSILALIIPQSLIFLFTLTYSLSVTKLSRKGILIQKKGAIDELAKINVLCMDKTGTITTNEMKLFDKNFFNVGEEEIGKFYISVSHEIFGKNKTQEILEQIFSSYESEDYHNFEQIPFTSKNKFSLIQAEIGERYKRIIFGAPNVLEKWISPKTREEVKKVLANYESKGLRILLGLYFQFNEHAKLNEFKSTDQVMIFAFEESLNPGIREIIKKIQKQNIELKVISGDSLSSVQSIVEKIGISTDKVVDLSQTRLSVEELALEKQVFARARPEDKLSIIKQLKEKGLKVAMVGDGVNDVLGMKKADVGIAMESGSKITREIADIVLLKNDYRKIPEIFFEGNNIIFNLRFASKIFLAKSIITMVLVMFVSFVYREPLPIFPTSTLLFGFFASSVPSYIVSFTREAVVNSGKFMHDVFLSSVPSSIVLGTLISFFYVILKLNDLPNEVENTDFNTALTMCYMAFSLLFVAITFWESRKLTKLPVLILMYGVGVVGSALFTFLPIIKHPIGSDRFILTALTTYIGSFVLFLFLRLVLSKLQPKLLKTSWVITILAILLGTFFPVSSYYNITPISIYYYIYIQILTLIGLLAIIVQKKTINLMLQQK
ncbi:MAG: carbonate dehydratase [Candidatus Dojkabacteria bacterium]|nr:MAG: carbonate dehydratase [Candidatus Dojkabacteria bacterium]